MGRLNISGHVVYLDGDPADNANVTIWERDSASGGKDDKILVRTTGPDGKFFGRSEEWKDREGFVFVNIPDIQRLEFTVEVDGRMHKGPFLLMGSSSATVVLPWVRPQAVPKDKRELVQVIYVSTDYEGAEKALYDFIELSTESIAQGLLGSKYRKITVLKGDKATLNGFVSALDHAASSNTLAIDVIFTTHGGNENLHFYDGEATSSKIKKALLSISAEKRKKFRILYSTACFGASHLDEWQAGGFKDVSGSEKIHADAAVSYMPFVAAWGGGKSFAESVSIANAADVFDAADGAARLFYKNTNRSHLIQSVNSNRLRIGGGGTRIHSKP